MKMATLRKAVQASPFKPFVAYARGKKIKVSARDQILLAADGSTIVVAPNNQRFHILDVSDIARVQMIA